MLKAMLKAWEKEAYGTSGDIDDTIAWAQVKKDAKIAEKIAKEKLCCFDECKASGVNVIFIHAPSSSFFGDLGEFILGKTVNWDQERKLWGGKKWKGNFNVPCNNEK